MLWNNVRSQRMKINMFENDLVLFMRALKGFFIDVFMAKITAKIRVIASQPMQSMNNTYNLIM